MIDLALLQPEWIVTPGQINLSTFPTQVLKANPRRFAVMFCYLNNPSPPDAHENECFLLNTPDALRFGRVLVAMRPVDFDFPHFAAYVQQEFWARDSGANVTAPGAISWVEVVQTANQKK